MNKIESLVGGVGVRKVISLLLATVMLICSFNFSVSAETTTEETDLLYLYYTSEIIEMYSEAAQALKQGLLDFEEDIDMTAYDLEETVFEAVYKSVLWENPDIYYVDQTYVETTFVSDTKKVISIRPQYIIDQSEYRFTKVELMYTVNTILDSIDTSWPAYKQLRYIHDYLDVFVEYDTDVSKYGNILYSAYGALVDGRALCHGYTLAYNYIVNQLGFETAVVSSETMNHTWSMVKIEDQWYHVDVTWDDPSGDLLGRANHTYFLVSDTRMHKLRPRQTWNKVPEAPDTTYDNAWWRDVSTFIYTIGDTDYYIDHHYTASEYGALIAHNTTTNTSTVLKKIMDRWYVDDTHTAAWTGNFSQLIYHNGAFCYNTTDMVYSINYDGTGLKVLWKKDADETRDIFGLVKDKYGNIFVELQVDPNTVGEKVLIYNNSEEDDILPPVVVPDDTTSTEPSESTTATTQTPDNPTTPTEPSTSVTEPTESTQAVQVTMGPEISAGKEYKLNVKTSQKVVYKSETPTIVSVNKKGKVTGLKKGTGIVRIQVGDSIIKYIIKVIDNPKLTNTSNKKISKVKVKKGQSVTVNISGKASSINNVYTSSSNAKIKGKKNASTIKVKGKKKGTSYVYVKVNGVKNLKLKVIVY